MQGIISDWMYEFPEILSDTINDCGTYLSDFTLYVPWNQVSNVC